MIQITPQMRFVVAVEPTDFRKGIDGLARLCKDVLKHDPFGGWVFVFRNRRATALKIPDRHGFWGGWTIGAAPTGLVPLESGLTTAKAMGTKALYSASRSGGNRRACRRRCPFLRAKASLRRGKPGGGAG